MLALVSTIWLWLWLVYVGTFDFCHTPPTLTLAHPNPSTSVNDPGAIEGSVQSRWWLCATQEVGRVGGVVE